MTSLTLPQITEGRSAPSLPAARQLTLVGANGAGKSRFMAEMVRLCGDRAYCLSALSAFFPEREPSSLAGSVDMLYEEAVRAKPYMQRDAVSEVDKLAYMLYTDEFESLLEAKQMRREGRRVPYVPTKLDRLASLWERIFPGNRIVRQAGTLMFATEAGDNIISAYRLSQGERTVLYYVAAVLYAMPDAVIFIDSPSLFLHPAILNNVWNAIEELRPDCTFVYDTVDVDFINSRTENVCVWVKAYDARQKAWDYDVLDAGSLGDDLFVDLIGSRKPVLFIEGDAVHSIDARLYTLVFTDYTVRPLGSCDKVIESTRTFNDLKHMHHLDSHGIVDRDRRTEAEVEYLRRKRIFVPDVAEVENIFLLEEVIRVMARRRGRDPQRVFPKVRRAVMKMFASHLDEQVLLHVRHQVKRDVECRVDGRFPSISAMETHLRSLAERLEPRRRYESLRAQFKTMLEKDDYTGVLMVFNHKPMLPDSNVSQMLGFKSKDEYIAGVLSALKGGGRDASRLRAAIKHCFGIDNTDAAPDEAAPAPQRQMARKPQGVATTPERSGNARAHGDSQGAGESAGESPLNRNKRRRYNSLHQSSRQRRHKKR